MFKRIDVQQAKILLEQKQAQCIDIRDAMSYQQGHIPQAALIDSNNINQWLAHADKQKPVLVYCYHGNSSQSAAQYIYEQGFSEAYSMDGGFEAWRSLYAADITLPKNQSVFG